MVVDVRRRKYAVLPRYIHKPRVDWPSIVDELSLESEAYTFTGTEVWESL
jgi:hypothetical protein